jgi:exodeoxyribonuclease VII large subunit
MTAIDPAYTLGQLEVARGELLARLKAEGLLSANAERPMPLVPLRVGLVTSAGSAAEADFVDTLRRSGFAFDVVRIDVRVQGHDAPLDLVAGIREACAGGVDVVALVRGGGARTDLQAYDDERVARAIAACPIPVLTGVGHETDRSIADEVAHRSVKTPTACAAALVELVGAFWDSVSDVWLAIADEAERAVAAHDHHVEVIAGRTGRAAGEGLRAARHRLDARADGLRLAALGHLRDADRRAADHGGRVHRRVPRALAEAERTVASVASRVRAHDPDRTLARGWSITRRVDGTVVRSPDDVAEGDELRTLVVGGELRSAVLPASTVDDDG